MDAPTIADIVPSAPGSVSGGNRLAASVDGPEVAAPATDPLRPVATAADPLDYTFAGMPAALVARVAPTRCRHPEFGCRGLAGRRIRSMG